MWLHGATSQKTLNFILLIMFGFKNKIFDLISLLKYKLFFPLSHILYFHLHIYDFLDSMPTLKRHLHKEWLDDIIWWISHGSCRLLLLKCASRRWSSWPPCYIVWVTEKVSLNKLQTSMLSSVILCSQSSFSEGVKSYVRFKIIMQNLYSEVSSFVPFLRQNNFDIRYVISIRKQRRTRFGAFLHFPSTKWVQTMKFSNRPEQ
jgi:hypothetical protein